MKRISRCLCAALNLVLVGAHGVHGASASGFSMPAIFSDNMVVQRDAPVPIWGQAAPGEKVTVQFKTQEKSVTAASDGRWKVELDPTPVSAEPATLSVLAESGQATFSNVLVGEVWLCSGQSNMQTSSIALKAGDRIQDADNPEIRFFTAPRSGEGEWILCTTESARAFSATAYYFGLNLWKQLGIPVGLIVACEGASSIETWMSEESVLADDSLVDANGAKLIDEMEKFQEFYLKYPELSAEEREPTLMEHCLSNYVFARSFLNQDGTLKEDASDGVLWHMSLIKPVFSFNKFIVPIIPYAIKGAIWYQGETNALANGDPQYAQKQKLLIEGWRKLWNRGDFPFYLVQIPPCASYPQLAEFWLQQYMAAEITPRTALIPTVDVGDINDSHPQNKWDIGSRLALLAMKDTYGKSDIVATGPTFKSFTVNGSTVEIEFTNAGSGLTTKDNQAPDYFEVAGPDKKFVKADAKIEGDKVILTSPLDVTEYVRFAWDYVAEPNLRNKDGFPAFPFTTEEEFFLESPTADNSPGT